REKTSVPLSERTAASPAQLVQTLVADTEVVAHLVDHRAAHLIDDFGVRPADRADRAPVDRDVVRQGAGVLRRGPCQGDALIQPEQAGGAVVVFHGDGDVAHHPAQTWWQAVQRFADQFLEPFRGDLHHGAIVRRGQGDGSEPADTRPVSYASTTAWTRSRRPSLVKTLATWVFTVASLSVRAVAISALLMACATKSRTSRSRGVSAARSQPGAVSAIAGSVCGAQRSTRRRVMVGASSASPERTSWTAATRCSGV